MKNAKKIVCFLVLFCMAASMFVSCGKGEVIAVYSGKAVYEKEVRDIVNYYISSRATLDSTEEELQNIAYDAVRTYVRYRAMEKDLASKGYKIDDDALMTTVNETIAYLDESYTGGYDDWRNMYLVSKDFLKEDIRRYMIAELYQTYAVKTIEVTDEESYAYYMSNALNYDDPAGYTWTSVYRQILKADEEESAEDELNEYLRKIKIGVMTMDDVVKEMNEKYKEDDGYTLTDPYSGTNFTRMTDVYTVENIDEVLKRITEQYGELDPDAKSGTEAYNKYMSYLGDSSKAQVYYALQTLKPGETYSKVIKSIGGYYLLRLDSIKTDNGFTPYEEVKDDIKLKLLNEKIESAFDIYANEIEDICEISYIFNLTIVPAEK